MKWFLKCMRNYANFHGRARRREYWMFALFSLICVYAVWLLGMVISGDYGLIKNIPVTYTDNSAVMQNVMEIWKHQVAHYWYYSVLGFVFFLPGLAVTVRRLHDTGRSGWLLGLFWLIYAMLIGFAFSSIWLLQSTGGILAWFLCGFGMYLRMMVFLIAFIVWLCLPGDRGANRYGPDPKIAGE